LLSFGLIWRLWIDRVYIEIQLRKFILGSNPAESEKMTKIIAPAVLAMTLAALAAVSGGTPSTASVNESPLFSVVGVRKGDVLYLRAEPSPRAESIAIILPDATGLVGTGAVKLYGKSMWRRIRYGASEGWVNDAFLRREDGRRFSVIGVSEGDTLNVRAWPSAKARIVGTISRAATGIEEIGPVMTKGKATWRKIRFQTLEGWVNGAFLQPTTNGKPGEKLRAGGRAPG